MFPPCVPIATNPFDKQLYQPEGHALRKEAILLKAELLTEDLNL